MKNKSKKKIILIVISCITLISLGAFVYLNFIRIRNIFDLMYYERVHNTYCNGPFSTKPENKFQNMEQLTEHGRGAEAIYVEEGVFRENYKSKYLLENHHIRITFRVENKTIGISYNIDNVNGSGVKWYCYEYSVDDKMLTYTTNDPDDTEYRDFLYDIFLTDWFAANPSWRFSLDDLGDVIFIDSTVVEE